MGPKFDSSKKVTKVTKSTGARKQLRKLTLGGKAWKVMGGVPYPACGQVRPTADLPQIEENQSIDPTGKVVKPAEVKKCCGVAIAKKRGAKCSKCGTAFGKIVSPVGTFRELSRWFGKSAPVSGRKMWVTSPRGAVFPGTGKWMTQAELSESTEFMR